MFVINNLFCNISTKKTEEFHEQNMQSSANIVTKENNTVNNIINQTIQNKTQDVKNENTSTIKSNNTITKNANKVANIEIKDWRIVIPSIGLDAPIAEGTSTSIMNKYVGHFENTDFWNGNIALAAHNRGYPVNYFANIKNLKKGEIIKYYYYGNFRQYKIDTITIICDTDWTYLKTTKDNRITLITCVENQPEYRRCIQAVEI